MLIQYFRQKRDAYLTEDQCSIVGEGARRGLIYLFLKWTESKLTLYERGIRRSSKTRVCTSCVCKVFRAYSNERLFASFGEGVERSIYHERYLKRFLKDYSNYYTSDSLWKIWLVESIQSIHNSLWTWHDKCNICCRYCIYHFKFNVCLVTKPLGVFSSETEWLNGLLLPIV